MRILYFSDKFGYNVLGVKWSIFGELKARGIDIIYKSISDIGKVLELVDMLNPDQIWLAHSSLVLPCDKALIKKPVIGFGFSDPHYFSPTRLESYDAYVTKHYGTYLKCRDSLPTLFCSDSCNFKFHRNMELTRDIDASCIGSSVHPRFKNKNYRIEIIDQLRRDTNLNICAYGAGWPQHDKNFNHIEGSDFLNVINRSKIGLDLQDNLYGPPQRIFEYCGCGTPIIVREGEEIDRIFVKDKEILTYNDYAELREKLVYYLGKPDKLKRIGLVALERCVKEHDVRFRVTDILAFIERELG